MMKQRQALLQKLFLICNVLFQSPRKLFNKSIPISGLFFMPNEPKSSAINFSNYRHFNTI